MIKLVKLNRETRETKINLELELYGQGKSQIETGLGFFDHMLELWSVHGFFDLYLKVEGDLEVDAHHTVEDVGILIGQALNKGLENRAGINRYGQKILPMDETLILTALDLSGRCYYLDNFDLENKVIANINLEVFREFFKALSDNAKMNLHFKVLRSGNSHHLLEAGFKSLGKALDQALQVDERLNDNPLSTKGSLGESED